MADPIPEFISKNLKDAQNNLSTNRLLFKKLKKENSRVLDRVFHTAHDEVFEKVDCLKCANCCKTTSPIFYESDISRLAKHLRLKPSVFIETYLTIDEDKDYVLKQAPCPFLGYDNYCSVYSSRPAACREYPHTNRKKIHQLLNLTIKNTLVCPAVAMIVNTIREQHTK